MTKAHGFESDLEFMNVASHWLRARAARIGIGERELHNALETQEEETRRGPPVQQLRCRVVALREKEEQLHKELLERLNKHRMGDAPPLGIDVVAEESRLDEDERLVLVAVTLACIGNPVADNIFGGLAACYRGGLQACDAAQLLVGATSEPSEWVACRRLFLPTSPLLRDGHLEYDRAPTGVEDLMDVSLKVGRQTFATITGTEPEPKGYESQGGQR